MYRDLSIDNWSICFILMLIKQLSWEKTERARRREKEATIIDLLKYLEIFFAVFAQ